MVTCHCQGVQQSHWIAAMGEPWGNHRLRPLTVEDILNQLIHDERSYDERQQDVIRHQMWAVTKRYHEQRQVLGFQATRKENAQNKEQKKRCVAKLQQLQAWYDTEHLGGTSGTMPSKCRRVLAKTTPSRVGSARATSGRTVQWGDQLDIRCGRRCHPMVNLISSFG